MRLTERCAGAYPYPTRIAHQPQAEHTAPIAASTYCHCIAVPLSLGAGCGIRGR